MGGLYEVSIFFFRFLGFLVSFYNVGNKLMAYNVFLAEGNEGKIELTKTATKVSSRFDETNLEEGRFADVTLNVKANSYSGTYLAPVEKHLIPYFGNMNINDILGYTI